MFARQGDLYTCALPIRYGLCPGPLSFVTVLGLCPVVRSLPGRVSGLAKPYKSSDKGPTNSVLLRASSVFAVSGWSVRPGLDAAITNALSFSDRDE